MNNTDSKENTNGLLYSAYHKLYSALNSLEKFEKGTSFFDNISHLDNFFSEYNRYQYNDCRTHFYKRLCIMQIIK